VDVGTLQKRAELDRDLRIEQADAKPISLPKIPQVVADRRELDDIAGINEFPYGAFEQVEAGRLDPVVFHTSPNSYAADKYRLLRMRLRGLSNTRKLRSILVTSPLPGDGKTTVSLNLATALANQRKHKVLLIEADLHRGCIAEQLRLRPDIGLKECLHDGLDPLAAIRRIEPFGWHLLQAGMLSVPQPTELLRPQDLSDLFRKMSEHFEWIVVDSPPVLALTDGIVLSQAADGSLFVARAEQTSREALEDALALIGRKHVLGLVLNGVSTTGRSYASYQNYYRRDAL